jgi:hypothetical protein
LAIISPGVETGSENESGFSGDADANRPAGRVATVETSRLAQRSQQAQAGSLLLTLAIEKGGHAPAKAQVSPEAPDRRKSMGGFLVTSPTIDKQISRNLLLWMSPI